MPLETAFSLAGAVATVGWVSLVFLPRWSFGSRLLTPIVIPALLAIGYGVLLLPRIFVADGDFGSLAGVRALFEVPELLLAGWVHYLAFDLFIGSWEVRDAQRVGVPHLLVVPCLVATFLAGPLGLALYFVLRLTRTRSWIDAAPV